MSTDISEADAVPNAEVVEIRASKMPTTSLQSIAPGVSLRRNFIWNLAGNVVYAACQWGILVVLAKLTSPEMVGRFALGLAITAPIIMLSQLQLRGVLATDTMDEYAFGHYLGLRLVTTFLALLVIGVVVLSGNYAIHTALVVLAVGISKAFESVSDVYYGLMQKHERLDLIARSLMMKGAFSLVALGLIVILTGDVLSGIFGLSLTWFLLLLFYDKGCAELAARENMGKRLENFGAQRIMRPDFHSHRLKSLTWMALPLGCTMALISLNTNIPRYFLEIYWGESQLGIFAALAYLVVAGNTVVSAMGQSVVPRLAKYYAAGDLAGYKYLLARLVGLALLLGVAGLLISVFAGRSLLTMLYRPEYAEQNTVFVWLMAVAAISYVASFLGYAMTAARYFQVQFPLFLVVTAVTFGTALWLIPRFALTGAVLALGVGSLVQLCGSGVVIRHVLTRRADGEFV